MRIIKKYSNRRLYDTERSSYITLEDIKKLILDEIDFKVVAAKGEGDLTSQVMTQVLIEEENPILTSFILKQIIMMYHKDTSGHFLKFLEQSIAWFSCEHKKYKPAVNQSMEGVDFFKQLSDLNQKQWDGWQNLMESFLVPQEKK